MSEGKGKRRWFQLRLATCIMLMVVAGGLVWANVRDRYEGDPRIRGLHERPDVYAQLAMRGWPFVAAMNIEYYSLKSENSVVHLSGLSSIQLYETKIIINLFTALLILISSAFACEFLIRCRERKHQDPQP